MQVKKIIIQNSVAFLRINCEISQRESKETTPFAIALKSIYYLGINLTQVEDLFTENYKMKDTSKWKDTPCSWIEPVLSLKCSQYPKQSTNLMQFL